LICISDIIGCISKVLGGWVARVRTTLNLDAELVGRARLVLGTDTTTATIHAALARVIAAAEVEALLGQDFSALDEAAIADLRTPRSAA
jgi:Arc/MetJ family transcription regulator